MPALSFSAAAAHAKPDVKVTPLCRCYLLLVLQEKHPGCFSAHMSQGFWTRNWRGKGLLTVQFSAV